jgi:thermitase
MTPRTRRRTLDDPRFESFAIQVEAGPGRETRAVVEKVVREELGEAWRIGPLDEPSGEYDVSRKARVDTARAWDLAYRLQERSEVVYAEPLFRFSTAEQHESAEVSGARRVRSGKDDDDPATEGKYEWSLDQIRAREAWERFFEGKAPGEGVLVGHPDTGFTRHPEIHDSKRLLPGHDFEDDDADATDPLVGGLLRHPGHGTGTASVIFSSAGPVVPGSADPFVSGVAPGASLRPIRTTKSVVLMSPRNLTRAIRYAAQDRAHVISISLGAPVRNRALHHAVQDAEKAGVIVLAAAGNQVGFVVWPAAFDEVIAVAASTIARTPWKKSCHGSAVDVTAPGASVYRAKAERKRGAVVFDVERGSGTSFAVAATAGLAALWLSRWGRSDLIRKYGADRVPGVFKQLLEKTCEPPDGWDMDEYGKGIVDAVRLLEEPLPAVAPARGMRGVARRAVSEDATGIETLVHLLGTAPRAGVERAVADLLRVHENRLPGALLDVGDELAFHLGTDPALRARLEAAAREPLRRAGRARARGPDRLSAARRAIASRGASRRLQGVLEGAGR